jgi:hypothetical protein
LHDAIQKIFGMDVGGGEPQQAVTFKVFFK